MDNPNLEEDIQKKLIRCNRLICEGNHYIVPFICASAVPYGRLFQKDLKSNPTVSDTFIALTNFADTNCFALTLIKFALERAGCAPEAIQELCDACRKAGSQKYPEYNVRVLEKEPFFERLQFHKMLVEVSDALTGEERHRIINLGSAFIKMNLAHTDSLLVHFLHLVQGDVIGPTNMSKIKEWLKAIQRHDVISTIDATLHCQELNSESILGGQLYPAPEQESRGNHRGIEEQGEVNGQSQMQQGRRFYGLNYGVHKTEPHSVEADKPQRTAEEDEQTGSVVKRKQLSAIVCITAFVLLITIASAAIFAWLEVYPTMKGQVFLRSGDAVIVQQNGFDPFHYTNVTFTKNQSSDKGSVQLYVQACSELMANKRAIHTNVTYINQSVDESSTFRIGSHYLVTGSEVLFNVNITAHTELPSCSAALYIFQDYKPYSNFLADGSDTDKARQICLLISNETSVIDHYPSYSFIADETSYYFIGLSIPRGSEGVDDIYYQTTGTQLYYATSNLSLACSIVPGTNSSCSVPLAANETIRFVGNTKCFLAVADSSPDNGLYLNYSSSSTTNPLHNIARIMTGLVALPLFFIVTTLFLVILLCAVHRSRHKRYDVIHNPSS